MNSDPNNKISQVLQYLKQDPEYLGYALIQLGLVLCGVQSLGKAANILNWNYQDAHMIMYSLKRCLNVKSSEMF